VSTSTFLARPLKLGPGKKDLLGSQGPASILVWKPKPA
jgi:hypothetical protein